MPTFLYLSEPEWRERQQRHEERVDLWTQGRRERAARGEKHPIEDFLFEYYAHAPAKLRRWSPGVGVILGGEAREFLNWRGFVQTAEGVLVEPGAFLEGPRWDSVAWILAMMRSTQQRPAHFGCFGLHEWAMVYRSSEVRHAAWPLRLSREGVAELVETQPVRCTHFDAFRFFTPAARPLNRWQLTRPQAAEFEQRGCLHANMDLYKWAFKLGALAPSDLVGDCFALARDLRQLDMRASPYDFLALGCEPVKIETPEGRAEYEREQRRFSQRAEPLRGRLIEVYERVLIARPLNET